LVNGALAQTFYHTRGLRQGDPLSSFLFVFAMEGLSIAIKSVTTTREIKGLQPHAECKSNTQQQFVDNKMLHGVPSVKEERTYK